METPGHTSSWVMRSSTGDRAVASFQEVLEARRDGSFASGKLFHPGAKEWTRADEIENWTVCRNCGYIGTPIEESSLNGCLLIVLLLLLLIPGIIYLVWGATTPKKLKCRQCGSIGTVVPVTAPNAFGTPVAVTAQQASSFCSACGKYTQGVVPFCAHCGAKIGT